MVPYYGVPLARAKEGYVYKESFNLTLLGLLQRCVKTKPIPECRFLTKLEKEK